MSEKEKFETMSSQQQGYYPRMLKLTLPFPPTNPSPFHTIYLSAEKIQGEEGQGCVEKGQKDGERQRSI
jgi:hypothetical protein